MIGGRRNPGDYRHFSQVSTLPGSRSANIISTTFPQ